MKKRHISNGILIILSLCLLLSSCGRLPSDTSVSAPAPIDTEYTPYVKVPSIHPLGEITDSVLSSPIPLPISGKEYDLLFMDNTDLWFYNSSDSNRIHQISFLTGKHTVGNLYDFNLSVPRYTMTEDGSVWHCYDSGGDNLTLARFDATTGKIVVEHTWPKTHGFAKLQGYRSDIFVDRVEFPDTTTWRYIVEKYNTKTKESQIITESTFKSGDTYGEFYHGLSVDNDRVFVLVNEKTGSVGNFVIRQYDLNGRLQKSYALPEYTEAYTASHSGAFDLEVFDGYIAIGNLNGYSALFQLTEKGEGKRIYFSEDVDDSSALTAEKPILVPQIENRATGDRYTVFKLDKQLIIYNRDTNLFSSVAINVSGEGKLQPVMINEKFDLLLSRAIKENNKTVETEYYLVDLNTFCNE